MNRLLSALLFCLICGTVSAAEPVALRLVIKDHRFEPTELRAAAGQKIKLLVENQDSSAEEFESYELNREKIVGGNATISVWIGPLEPGRYPFFGEFHAETAQGILVIE